METKAPKRNKSAETKAKRLTKKETAFVKEFAATGNGVQSALKAYDTDNYSVAGSIASENLQKPKIVLALEEALNDELLQEKHLELLNASRLDHMVFATGPRNEKERAEYIQSDIRKAQEKGYEYKEIEHVTDEDIREMLADVNCQVRRIVHRETARDVYFWSADNMARDKALDKAYKIKGKYAPEKHVSVNITVDASDRVKDLAKKLNA